MRTKHSVRVLIVLLGCLILSACAGTLDPPSDPSPSNASQIEVTPVNTSAKHLIVTINIDEDQDATDGMSNITVQFSTDVIEESNYVNFHHGEKITCNGITQNLNGTQVYAFKVPRKKGGYNCSYIGYKKADPLPSVPMIAVSARSALSPRRPKIESQHFKISYTRDASNDTCPITANASDISNNSVQGASSSSDLGVYTGPDTSSLGGEGSILLTRTCSWTLHNAFDTIFLTYQSTASVEVTWSH
jgi:hypothetical protein